MKKTLTFLALAVFVAFSCSFPVEIGQTGRIGVGTYDTTGLPKDLFGQGEDVRIIADSSHMPMTISVTDSDDLVVYNETYYDYTYDKILSGLTEKLGKYIVEATSPWDEVQKNYARTYLWIAAPFVGGRANPIDIPISNPESQVPWIWPTTIILQLVALVVYVKKRKRNTETNS